MATLDSVDVGDHVRWLVVPGDDYHGTARSYLKLVLTVGGALSIAYSGAGTGGEATPHRGASR